MAGIRSGIVVAGLTAAALSVVGVLAVQASGSAPDRAARRASRPAAVSPSASPSKARVPSLPAGSGSGRRVVYSLGNHRVWLVDEAGKATDTFTVTPGSVDPLPGTYTVASRNARGIGGDGVAIEHVVRFATVGAVTIGFSAAQDGSMPASDASEKTGGIREKRADAEALWELAVIGTKVVVVA